MGTLVGRVVNITDLTSAKRDKMYLLMTEYYSDIERGAFYRDLDEKDGLILLFDSEDQTIKGFSTLMGLRIFVDNKKIRALFSGDTVVDFGYRGQFALHKTWLMHVLAESEKEKESKLFWFLTSKGYKTYRMLPLIFRTFYPNYKTVTPAFEQKILHGLASMKYPTEYSQSAGVIYHGTKTDRVKDGVADIGEKELIDPHVRFFVEKNPAYFKGDDLACIAEINRENLTETAFALLS